MDGCGIVILSWRVRPKGEASLLKSKQVWQQLNHTAAWDVEFPKGQIRGRAHKVLVEDLKR